MKPSDNSHAAYSDDGTKLPTNPPNTPMNYDTPEMPTAQNAHAAAAMHHAANERRYEQDYHQVTGGKLFPHGTRTGAGYHSSGHPGFKSVQASIAKREGVSKERAGAILAASSRRASPAAKKANPRLKRVGGGY